jgi:hypothetical protein
MSVDPLSALSFGLQVFGLSSAEKAQRRERRLREAVQRERRAAKKAALKAIKKAYREADEDSSRAMKEALKSGETALYKTVGGTTSANFARGMFRQYGIQQRQARREEAKALADIEGRSTLEANDFAGLAAGEGALAEMRSNLIKSGIDLFKNSAQPQLVNSPSPTGAGKPVQPVTADSFGQNVGTQQTRTPGPYANQYGGYYFQGGVTDSFKNPALNAVSGLFSGIGQGFRSAFNAFSNLGSIFSTYVPYSTYTGYQGQTYYNDPVAMQSKPVNSNVFPG